MATRNYSVVESDLSGATDAETVTVGFDGIWYEVDLTEAETKKLRKALDPYLNVGRKLGKTSRRPLRRGPGPSDTTSEEREEIRAWAEKNGYEVAPKGRIAKHVVDAYRADQGQMADV